MPWLLLHLPAAQAQSSVEVADFALPRRVTGLIERTGPPGCTVHFEYEDPATGWTRFRYGLSVPTTWPVDEPWVFTPPHDSSPFGHHWCGNVDEYEAMTWTLGQVWLQSTTPWRIVGGDGVVLTTFAGPYAVDALPLAAALDALDDYREGKADPACAARVGTDCWTAFELWVYLEDWATTHCNVEDGTTDAMVP